MKQQLLSQAISCYIIQSLFLCSAILASSIKLKRNNNDTQIETRIANRNILVDEMFGLENLLIESVELEDNSEQTQSLLNRLGSLLTEILDESDDIIYKCMGEPDLGCFDNELNFQEKLSTQIDELKKRVARFLFKANLRYCESPDETYYEPMDQCVSIYGNDELCHKSMSLKDGPDNKSYCDCSAPGYFLYSAETGRCHKQNSQGPCQRGKWFILKDGKPVCLWVPEGCPANGEYVYWSRDSTTAKQCWKMGAQGPCPKHRILAGTGGFDVSCQLDPSLGQAGPGFAAPLRPRPKCPPGTYLNQRLQCRQSFF